MAEIRTHEQVLGIIGVLAHEANDDGVEDRSEYSAETRAAWLWLEETDAALRLALETAERERGEIAVCADGWMKRTVAAERERDEARRHAEEQLADVLRLRFLGIEFASQYGDRALACKYDNSCDDSGREPECIPCAFRRALGLMGVN